MFELERLAGRKRGCLGLEPSLQEAAAEYRHLPRDGVLLGGTPEAEAQARRSSGWPLAAAGAGAGPDRETDTERMPTLATIVRAVD